MPTDLFIPEFEFPNERSESAAIRSALGREFEFCHRIFRFWFEVEKNKWLRESVLPADSLNLAMALHTQGCRQMRSILEQCGRCEGFNASILGRSLFETVLAAIFLLKKDVHISVNSKPKKDGTTHFWAVPSGKENPKNAANWLSHKHRADLYVANYLLGSRRIAAKCEETHGIKSLVRFFDSQVDQADIDAYTQAIGPDWTYIIQRRAGYSGLSISQLSRLLHKKLHHWYVIVYGVQSGMTHGSDAMLHLREVSPEALGSAFLSTQANVFGVLHTAAMLFRILMATMQNEIGFGSGVETALYHFQREFIDIFNAKQK